MVDRTIKSQTVTLTPNQILTKELSPDMKQWEELIRGNMFRFEGHRDHLLACLAHMLYCVVAKEQYNLAYFFVKRIECARANPTANLLYGMFLTSLYRHIMEAYPYLNNGIYDIVDRVMRPLALKQTRRPRSDRGKARLSVLSSSSHHHGKSSHQHDDDDDRAPNAPSKTPSTKDTSSSSIDYIPKSPTSSTSLLPNGYLNPPTSPPPRGNPQMDLQDQGVIDSGCSRHMTGNMSYLTDFEEIDGGYVAFGGNPKGGKITGRGTIKTGNLDFENVYFVRELKFNLFSVSQMCDKKNSVLFNDTECIVLSPNFKLTDESHVLLKVPRKNNMYSVDLKNIVPKGGLTCLFAKATSDESKLWHRRLGHINFKTMNKLVKGNLVRGLPSKLFENNQTCVACQKGKQHRASCKSKTVSSISQPLHMLHMDLFGPTFVKSLMKKMYCLVVTDDYSRFSWVFFLATKDKTSGILKSFITGVENLIDQRVKVIRCDNGTELKNKEMNQFCERKCTKASDDAGKARVETIPGKDYILLPLWTADPPFSQSSKSSPNVGFKPSGDDGKKDDENPRKEGESMDQEKKDNVNSINNDNVASINEVNVVGSKISIKLPDDPNMPELEDIVYSNDDEDVGVEADINNLDAFMPVSLISTTRVHKDHPIEQIIRDLNSTPQTRRMIKNLEEHGLFSSVAALKFANSHNMVAFLAKPTKSKGFEHTVDFLNANPIKYALTMNSTIYTSCIEQLWATAKVKIINKEVQLQAQVDRKKVIITEASVRRDLQLEDVEGIESLPNAAIFEQLALMGYEKLSQKLTFYKAFFSPRWKFLIHTILQYLSAKSTAWNEFSIIMASAIICLATNQKFNFSKYIFESMVKNLDSLLKRKWVKVQPCQLIPIIQPLTSQSQKKKPRRKQRKGPKIPKSSVPTEPEADKAVYEERDDNLERAATIATSLDGEQDRGGSPRHQDTMRDTIAQTRSENVSKHFNNLLLSREDSLQLKELMDFCTKLQQRVLDLENSNTTQAVEITSLKKRVKKLKKKKKSRTYKLKRLYKVGLSTRIDSLNDEASLVHDLDGDEVVVKHMDASAGEKVFVAKQSEKVVEEVVSATEVRAAIITEDEMTLAQALAELKSVAKDKGKCIMVKEPLKIKKKDQISFDKQEAIRLQAQFDEEERIVREKEEANAALIAQWNDIQDKVETDYELAQRLTVLVEESSKKVEAEIAQESSSKRAGEELE
ncbi:putative ribonuclease H-like domain-containing protein [Tanacetum coccineum]